MARRSGLEAHTPAEITIGYTGRQRIVFVSVPGRRVRKSARNMKKESTKRRNDDLRPEYDLTRLGPGVRGKYYRQAIAGTNLILIEPELATVFHDSDL